MISQETVATLYGSEVYDRNDDRIGVIGQVYAAEEAGQPVWVSVRTGWFGQRESLVPIDGAQWEAGQRLRVPYDKEQIKAAPHVDASANEPIEADELTRLYQHYNLQWQAQGRQPAERPGAEEPVTVSEERLRVGTERQEVGKARLHKYVVTEPVQTTVPVSYEEVRVVHEPIQDRDRPTSADIGEAEREVVLHAERPVTTKETVPVERVRLDVEAVSDQETVGSEVRKERVEADVPEPRRRA
jgi:stress response protein YsnF